MKRDFVMVAALLLTCGLPIAAKEKHPIGGGVLDGSRIFISEMEGKLDGFIASEVIKQRLPVRVVLDEKDADFVLAGASIKADDKWYHVAFGGKDKNEGNVKLLDIKSRTMVWAGEAGDRSLWYGGFRRGGQRKVADRIVRQLKKDLFH